jgi:hypothetical protein
VSKYKVLKLQCKLSNLWLHEHSQRMGLCKLGKVQHISILNKRKGSKEWISTSFKVTNTKST